MTIEAQKGEVDPRTFVYDELREINEDTIPHAKKLFVIAGQRGIGGGYFFEKSSAEYLGKLQQVEVTDEEGKTVVTLSSLNKFIHDFYIEKADWVEEGKEYKVSKPEIEDDQIRKLYNLRAEIHQRLMNEGTKAMKEFWLVGTAMGGEEDMPEDIARDFENTIRDIGLPQEQIDRFFSGLEELASSG